MDNRASLYVDVPVSIKRRDDFFRIFRTLQTSGLLDAANYRRYVVPVISRIFPVRDAQIRQVLLQYLPSFVRHMEIDFLRQQLLPEVRLNEPVHSSECFCGSGIDLAR